jgi:hypothetical protein
LTKIGGMPRRARVLIEGGVYHVYNRVASDEPVFADPEEAIRFIDLIRSLAALSKPNGEMRCQTKHHGSDMDPTRGTIRWRH